MTRRAAWGLLLVLGACASQAPQDVLRDYRSAVAEGRIDRVRSLSDAHFRDAYDPAALAKQLRKNPRLFTEAAARLEGLERLEMVGTTSSGERVRLVLEDGRWRVAEGGLLMPDFGTPEGVTRTFFFAATGHIELLRDCLPEEAAQRFASDYQLGKHLHTHRERIFAARDELGPITDGMAVVKGKRARIPYGTNKAVELILEGDRWRVVDLE